MGNTFTKVRIYRTSTRIRGDPEVIHISSCLILSWTAHRLIRKVLFWVDVSWPKVGLEKNDGDLRIFSNLLYFLFPLLPFIYLIFSFLIMLIIFVLFFFLSNTPFFVRDSEYSPFSFPFLFSFKDFVSTTDLIRGGAGGSFIREL